MSSSLGKALLALLVLWCGQAFAATFTATSCSQSAVQAAIKSATDGDIVNVPASSATWSSPVTVAHGITLNFQNCAITASGGTIIVQATCTTNCSLLSIMNINLTGASTDIGAIQIDGYWPNYFRIGYATISNLTGKAVVINYNTWFNVGSKNNYGLIDHMTFTGGTTDVSACFGASGANDVWLSGPNFGTNNFVYYEDNTFTFNSWSPNSDIVDASAGCRYVIRHNTVTDGGVYGHDLGSEAQMRGQRACEIYSNNFYADATSNPFEAASWRGGQCLIYNNNIPIYEGGHADGWATAFFTQVQRDTSSGSAPFDSLAGASTHKVCSDMRSHCSTSHTPCGMQSGPPYTCSSEGTGTCQNACTVDADCGSGFQCVNLDGAGTGGYLVRDQTGTSADAPTTHIQSSAPFYVWNNIDGLNGFNGDNHGGAQLPSSQVTIPSADQPYIQINRDFYWQTASFNGTSGMGTGLLSARPSTCTPLVGYFATDTNTLYQCSSTNTWTAFYTPYAYPHPLQGSGAPSPPPPTGLAVQVQ